MHETLHVINSFWHGSELTEIGELCIKSFLKNGFTFKLWTYDTKLKVPKGCEVADASKIIKKQNLFFHKEESWVPFSIWFRFKLLYERGGVWTDLDVICLKQFKIKNNTLYGEQPSLNFFSLQKGNLLALEMETMWRYPHIKRFYDDEERKTIKKRLKVYKPTHQRQIVPWKFLGNDLFNILKQFWTFNIKSIDEIYPISSKNFEKIFDGSVRLNDIKDSCCIHLWNELLRRKNYDYSKSSDESIFKELKRKYD